MSTDAEIVAPGIGLPGGDEADESLSVWQRALGNVKSGNLGVLPVVIGEILIVAFFSFTATNFFTASNFVNVILQMAGVTMIAFGVVFVLLIAEIDLSIGFLSGIAALTAAELQLPDGRNYPGWLCILIALGVVAIIGAGQGAFVAKVGVPSFVVTLGGLMSFRGAAFLVADGKTQPVTDPVFLALGGGLDGALGPTLSWALGAVLAALLVWNTLARRRSRHAHGFPLRPAWLDAALAIGFALLVFLFVAAMCAYQLPGKTHAQGIPVPVVIWGAVVMTMAFIVRRTRFGRYVYAIGGNPEAALLVGIPVKRVTLQLFLLLAVLVTVAAVVSVARLNAGTNSLGSSMELYVIAAAVIGGVALAGGSGSVLGSVLGALIIQFLESCLLLMDVSIGKRMVIIGQVLIVAVVFDVLYRRWSGERIA